MGRNFPICIKDTQKTALGKVSKFTQISHMIMQKKGLRIDAKKNFFSEFIIFYNNK
jgi:hypothetical protein